MVSIILSAPTALNRIVNASPPCGGSGFGRLSKAVGKIHEPRAIRKEADAKSTFGAYSAQGRNVYSDVKTDSM